MSMLLHLPLVALACFCSAYTVSATWLPQQQQQQLQPPVDRLLLEAGKKVLTSPHGLSIFEFPVFFHKYFVKKNARARTIFAAIIPLKINLW